MSISIHVNSDHGDPDYVDFVSKFLELNINLMWTTKISTEYTMKQQTTQKLIDIIANTKIVYDNIVNCLKPEKLNVK